MIEYLQYIIPIISCIRLWLTGNKWKYAPVLGIFNQVLWFIYVLSIEQYGLLIGVVIYTAIHIRNLRKWVTNADR